MKRWIVRGVVAIALGALIAFIAANTYFDTIQVPTPLQGDAVTNPFYAAQRFAEALGARTDWRHTLGASPAPEAVIVLSNWHWSVVESRRRQLETWVEAGGRLLLDHTLIDDEDHEFRKWTGIRPASYDDDEEKSEDEPENDATAANDTAFDFEEGGGRCASLRRDTGDDGLARDTFEICKIREDTWLELSGKRATWSLRDESGMQAIRVQLGRGSVTMLNAEPFGNRDLMNHDHGALFVAASGLRRGDEIIFLSEEEHDSLLSLMWQYGAPVVLLCVLLLVAALVRAGARFGPLVAVPDRARRSIAEQIRGTGRFTLRFGGGQPLHAAMVRALHEAAQSRIANYHGLAQADRIAAIAKLTGIDAEGLAETINYSGARRAGELRNAVMVLEFARRALLDMKTKRGS